MPGPQIASSHEIQLFASDGFIREAMASDIGRMTVNDSEAHDIVRIAQLGEEETIGAIALLSTTEAQGIDTKTPTLRAKANEPGSKLERAFAFHHIRNGFPTAEQTPWADIVQGHLSRGGIFRLSTKAKEPSIAKSLYVAASGRPTPVAGDKEVGGNIQLGGAIVGSLIGDKAGQFAQEALHKFGEVIGDLRKQHDMEKLTTRRPVMLEHR